MLNPLEGTYGANRAGYVIHSAVHAARPDVQCVIHTHGRASMAIGALKCGLLPLTQTAMRFGTVAYHDYQGVAVDLQERESLAQDLGDAEVMLLRNHGLLVASASIAQAFNAVYWLRTHVVHKSTRWPASLNYIFRRRTSSKKRITCTNHPPADLMAKWMAGDASLP